MSVSIHDIKNALKEHEFHFLFHELLGWDRRSKVKDSVEYGDRNHVKQKYEFELLADKEKFKIYLHTCDSHIPETSFLKKLDEKLNNLAEAHLTIFADAQKKNQLWLWVKREKNRAVSYPTRLNERQSGDILAQKVRNLYVSFEEEEKGKLTLIDILNRVTLGFDVEKVAKRFYDGFQKQHDKFLEAIKHIPDEEDRKHYTSIMLNRLMFVYFIQRKGLLDNSNPNNFDGKDEYLQIHLAEIREKESEDDSGFYKNFLLPLFHEGLNKREHSNELKDLIGEIPYLNGGIFDKHALEDKYPNIEISNKTFKKLFDFFTEYDWHLDDRSSRVGNEINPDVLGYIFEKYINQKQMGAYYTKEDITGYISRNTIIPYIFERVARERHEAFLPGGPTWSLLQKDPDTYIYEALLHGYTEELPADIEAGITDIIRRTRWNQAAVELDEDGKPTDEAWAGALATETWREVVARRQRYDELHQLMVEGKISSINDLITYNLNITKFASDVIESCDDPGMLRSFYEALSEVTVLDPTCGSGAFLFATLNILKPLYYVCLARIKAMLAEHEGGRRKIAANHLTAFQDIQKRMGQPYHVLKTIIVNNLYGVDIMDEAIEICKLRLFLALVAQLEKPKDLEPLPDIDFNVLAGNTLIGFTSLDEVRRVTQKLVKLGNTEEMLADIEKRAKSIDQAERDFRRIQTEGVKVDATAKQALRKEISELRDVLNPYLATEYGKDKDNIKPESRYKEEYARWHETHQPFHWWMEFYEIMHNGGFDVVIGNPPYVEYSKVKKTYKVKGYKTEGCGNLYALSMERMELLARKAGVVGAIIPVSSISTDGYLALQKILTKSGKLVVSNYDDRPSKLFDGLEHIRLSIILHYCREEANTVFTTKYNKWNKEEREKLFSKLMYTASGKFIMDGSIPKLQSETEKSILQKVLMQKKNLSLYERKRSNHLLYYSRKLSGFVQVLDHMARVCDAEGKLREPSELKIITFDNPTMRNVFLSILNSSLFYWFLTVYSDCRHLNKREVYAINFDYERTSQETIQDLSNLAQHLMKDLDAHSQTLELNYEKQGRLSIQCFYPKHSKPIIDEIDHVLAQHYGFTDEELDFIINYDIKYRMGRENGDEGEE